MSKLSKLIILLVIILSIICITKGVNAESYEAINPVASNNNASFNNMKLPADKADPFILKSNDKYYLYSTGNKNGIKYYCSSDMQNWIEMGYALDNPDVNYYNGLWAPEVYEYNGKYYMIYTAVKKTDTNYEYAAIHLAMANNLNEKFQDVKKIDVELGEGIKYIDGTLFFENEKMYMYFKNEADGCIYIVELDANFNAKSNTLTKILGVDLTWESRGLEGPCVIKKNEIYYLMYSTGNYKDDTYKIGYATSNSLFGPFIKQNTSKPLLQGDEPLIDGTNKIYDSKNYVYGTGHNNILKVSDDEIYIVYHSIIFENNQYKTRKLNIDYLGFDSQGTMFVNAPTKYEQALPSGTNDYYQLSPKDYTILVNGEKNDISILKDQINFCTRNAQIIKADVSSFEINLSSNKNISDIWLYGDGTSFKNKKINIIIDDKYIIKNVDLTASPISKIELPKFQDNVKNIKVEILNGEKISLTEVKPIYISKAEEASNAGSEQKSETIKEAVQTISNNQNVNENTSADTTTETTQTAGVSEIKSNSSTEVKEDIDNSTATKILPHTGFRMIILGVISIIVVNAIILFKKYRGYKDVI